MPFANDWLKQNKGNVANINTIFGFMNEVQHIGFNCSVCRDLIGSYIFVAHKLTSVCLDGELI